MLRILLLLTFLAVPCPTVAQSPATACAAPERHELDFWIGRWRLEDAQSGQAAGTSLIAPLWGGCAILEMHEAPGGFTGGSLVQWVPQDRVWRLAGGGSAGVAMLFQGAMDGRSLVLTSPDAAAKGGKTNYRMILQPLPDGTVRQTSHLSRDDGATWRLRYDYVYHREPS